MPRRPRQFIEGGIYHVYNRVASGEEIFSEPEVAVGFLDLVREVRERDGWTVFAWCLMSNHYHLVVRSSAVPLARSMQSIQSNFGRWFNRRSRRTGGVWQSRYQAKLVDEEGYLARVILYVHLNPIRGGVVQTLADYVFCGHREIIRGIKKSLIDVDDALLSFGTTTRSARKGYNSAVRAGVEAIKKKPANEPLDFRSLRWRDRKLEAKPGQEYVDELGRSSGRERQALTAQRYLAEVCGLLGIDEKRLADREKDRETVALRRLVAALGIERWRQRCTDLAGVLGKNPGVVSYWVGEGVRRRNDDPGFAKRIDDLDERLAEVVRAGQERQSG
jgi:REP element-mobilizing transposase RayT